MHSYISRDNYNIQFGKKKSVRPLLCAFPCDSIWSPCAAQTRYFPTDMLNEGSSLSGSRLIIEFGAGRNTDVIEIPEHELLPEPTSTESPHAKPRLMPHPAL